MSSRLRARIQTRSRTGLYFGSWGSHARSVVSVARDELERQQRERPEKPKKPTDGKE